MIAKAFVPLVVIVMLVAMSGCLETGRQSHITGKHPNDVSMSCKP